MADLGKLEYVLFKTLRNKNAGFLSFVCLHLNFLTSFIVSLSDDQEDDFPGRVNIF